MSTKQEMDKIYPDTQYLPGGGPQFVPQPTAPPSGVAGYTPMVGAPNTGPIGATGAAPPVYYMQTAPLVLQFGPREMMAVCPACQTKNMTKVRYESTSRTHLIAGILCLLTCCCCCLPYCFNGCKSALHYCSNCNAYLGQYSN